MANALVDDIMKVCDAGEEPDESSRPELSSRIRRNAPSPATAHLLASYVLENPRVVYAAKGAIKCPRPWPSATSGDVQGFAHEFAAPPLSDLPH